MGSERNKLIQEIWAALNWETMSSRAWAKCFAGFQDLKSDDYRQIALLVSLWSSIHPNECTLAKIQRTISQRDLLDQKTIATRVQRLIDCKLLETTPHPTDRRKKLIRPTRALRDPLSVYSEMTKNIAAKINDQSTRSAIARQLDDDINFNILDYLCTEDGEADQIGHDLPTRSQ